MSKFASVSVDDTSGTGGVGFDSLEAALLSIVFPIDPSFLDVLPIGRADETAELHRWDIEDALHAEVRLEPECGKLLEGHPLRADEAAAPEREAHGVDEHHVVADVPAQHEVDVEAGEDGATERPRD